MDFKNLYWIKIWEIFFIILTILSVMLSVCSTYIINNFSLKILSNTLGIILTVICPLIIGELHNEYKVKKAAINELCEKIIKVWDKASENDKLSKDKKSLEDNQNIRLGAEMIYDTWNFDKEVGIVYLLTIYFVNVKWYEHNLFNLPNEYKEKIREYLDDSKGIHFNILDYKSTDLEDLSQEDYSRFTPMNTKNFIEPFLTLIQKECSLKNKKKINEIIECRRAYDEKWNLN